MRRHLAVALLLLGLTACSPPPLMCPAIAVPAGLAIDVPAGQFSRAEVTACWAGHCTQRQVGLQRATTAGPTTCTPTACGASAVPTGGRYGFVEISGLPAAPVGVKLVLDGGAAKRTTVHPQAPKASQCGEPGVQVRLVVGPDGTVR
ncbi:hypothetical protein QRX50_06200 [Amycolatopsis carbonis]|uniref:Lipoprotein n=1 Tax=Amycolatopsis carbonis TaxID=715471 RepID=A0A9Y2IL75_9PSEU|nr:hypothetical protein [Amycolatopsis sp. 2-15]WIX80368.1 hypothetical protein QRX50_06200 [Amycolatopsis sp. 2-15]